MHYAIVTENDTSVFTGMEQITVRWGFGSIEEAQAEIATLKGENEGTEAQQTYHIVSVLRTEHSNGA